MAPSQRSGLGEQGRGDEKILSRHLFGVLSLNPLLNLAVLAMGTCTINYCEHSNFSDFDYYG